MRSTFIAALALFAISSSLFAQAPDSISFQGVLTNPGGTPLNDTLDITTTFHKGGVSGHSQVHTDVIVENGVYNILIGRLGRLTRFGLTSQLTWGLKLAWIPK